MALSSIVAIYFLFFAFSAFLLLPFGVRTDEEVGTPKVAGQADSAPHRFDLKRHLFRATTCCIGPTALTVLRKATFTSIPVPAK